MSYIGNQPVIQSTEFREEYFPTANQTAFVTGGFHPSAVSVTRNGVLLSESDYTKGSDNVTITLNSAAISGDVVVIRGNRSLVQGVAVSESRVEYTWQSGDTVVQLNADVVPFYSDVYLNGVKLAAADYSINASTKQVSFTSAPAVGDVIAVVHKNETSALVALPLKDSSGAEILSESGSTVTLENVDTATIGSNALVVDASGTVGVGVSNPTYPLQINSGSVQFSSGLKIDETTHATSARAGIQAGEWVFGQDIGGSGNRDFFFYDGANQATRLVIDSVGSVSINRVGTTQNASSGDNGLYYNNSAGYLVVGNDGDVVCVFNRWSSTGQIVQYRYNGSVVGSISATTNNLPSDRDFKKDINDLNLGLELVKKLKPKTYRYKIIEDNSPFMTGLIAQDLEESLAEVGVARNESWILQYNENVEEGNSKYELDYSKLIPVLAKAIQEQQALIESQQSQIDALTARIEALEATP